MPVARQIINFLRNRKRNKNRKKISAPIKQINPTKIIKSIKSVMTINKIDKKKCMLAVMAIFKNEEEYMEEWLKHHISQGIKKFYLYCNDPVLNKYNYFSKYNKYISIINWTNKVNRGRSTVQKQAYFHCIKNFSNNLNFISNK